MHLDAKSASRPHCDGQQHQQHRSQTVSPTATTTATAAATSAVAVANAVAKPLDKTRPLRTAVECPSKTRTATDGPGRCAHSYGSDGPYASRARKGAGGSAAPKCSNQTDLRLTLADLFYGSDLPERPSPTSTDLVCIQGIRRPGQAFASLLTG